eukprot:1868974-Amphidinium_carterae.9
MKGSTTVQSVFSSEDLLVQVLHILVHGWPGLLDTHSLLLKDPMLLTSKKDIAVMALVKKFLSSQSLFRGPGVVRWFHQVHDRGVSVGLRHAISGHVAGLCLDADGKAFDMESSSVVDIHTELGCSLHDCHNAIKWC